MPEGRAVKEVVFLLSFSLRHDGRLKRLVRSVVRAGYRARVIGVRRAGEQEEELRRLYWGGEVELVDCWVRRGVLFFVEWVVRAGWRVRRLGGGGRVVYACDVDSLLAVRLFGKGVPVVYEAREWLSEVPQSRRSWWRHFLWGVVERTALSGVRHGVTVNESLRDILGRRYGLELVVVRNVPDGEPVCQVSVEERLGRRVVAYVGYLAPGRLVEEVIESVALVQEKDNLDISLWVFGDGPLRGELERHAERKGLAVKWWGFVVEEELVKLLSGVAVGVNVCRMDAPSHYYSLSNKFFQYIYALVPQVTVDFPEYRRVLERWQVGLGVAVPVCTAIAPAIRKILTDRELYQRMVAECRRAAEHFSWAKEESVLLQVLSSAAEGK